MKNLIFELPYFEKAIKIKSDFRSRNRTAITPKNDYVVRTSLVGGPIAEG